MCLHLPCGCCSQSATRGEPVRMVTVHYIVLGVAADLVGVEEVAEDLHDEADQQQRAPGLVQRHRQPVGRVLLGPGADSAPQQRVPSPDIVN